MLKSCSTELVTPKIAPLKKIFGPMRNFDYTCGPTARTGRPEKSILHCDPIVNGKISEIFQKISKSGKFFAFYTVISLYMANFRKFVKK